MCKYVQDVTNYSHQGRFHSKKNNVKSVGKEVSSMWFFKAAYPRIIGHIFCCERNCGLGIFFNYPKVASCADKLPLSYLTYFPLPLSIS